MKKNKVVLAGFRSIGFLLLACFILIISQNEGKAKVNVQEKSRVQTEDKVEVKERVSSLIKKEMLPKLDPLLANARRDLFRPSTLAPLASAPAESAVPARLEPEKNYSEEEATSILETLNIEFLGLVAAGKTTLAVVKIDGQAIALVEGEEVIPGVKLAKITAEEIIFQDSQGNSRKILIKESFDESF